MLKSQLGSGGAAFFAERVKREAGGDAAAQIDLDLRLAFARPTKPSEQQVLQRLAKQYGLGQACRVLFNSSAFLYLQ